MPVNISIAPMIKTSYGNSMALSANPDYMVEYVILKPLGQITRRHNTLKHSTYYVLSGFGRYTDHAGTSYELRAGDRMVVAPGEDYSFEGSPNTELVMLLMGTNPPGNEEVEV